MSAPKATAQFLHCETIRPEVSLSSRSNFLNDEGNALSDSDAHRAERVFHIGAPQLTRGGGDESRATRAERVADCDCSAVWINVRRIVLQSKLPHHGKSLRRERFVQLDHIHLIERQSCLRQNFFRCWNWPDAHDARGNACHRAG